jgi:hypothetical protein
LGVEFSSLSLVVDVSFLLPLRLGVVRIDGVLFPFGATQSGSIINFASLELANNIGSDISTYQKIHHHRLFGLTEKDFLGWMPSASLRVVPQQRHLQE